MDLGDLQLNPDNPRTISKEKLKLLEKSLKEFGDLSGFVYNSKTKRMIGGHQRSKVFGKDAKIILTKKHNQPTSDGKTSRVKKPFLLTP